MTKRIVHRFFRLALGGVVALILLATAGASNNYEQVAESMAAFTRGRCLMASTREHAGQEHEPEAIVQTAGQMVDAGRQPAEMSGEEEPGRP